MRHLLPASSKEDNICYHYLVLVYSDCKNRFYYDVWSGSQRKGKMSLNVKLNNTLCFGFMLFMSRLLIQSFLKSHFVFENVFTVFKIS